jgi:hypothetical protein
MYQNVNCESVDVHVKGWSYYHPSDTFVSAVIYQRIYAAVCRRTQVHRAKIRSLSIVCAHYLQSNLPTASLSSYPNSLAPHSTSNQEQQRKRCHIKIAVSNFMLLYISPGSQLSSKQALNPILQRQQQVRLMDVATP